MKNNEIILYRLYLILNKEGYIYNIHKWTGSESKISYNLKLECDYFGSNRRISKDDIMKPRHLTIRYDEIKFGCWCFENQIEECKEFLYDLTTSTAKDLKKNALEMFKHIKD